MDKSEKSCGNDLSKPELSMNKLLARPPAPNATSVIHLVNHWQSICLKLLTIWKLSNRIPIFNLPLEFRNYPVFLFHSSHLNLGSSCSGGDFILRLRPDIICMTFIAGRLWNFF